MGCHRCGALGHRRLPHPPSHHGLGAGMPDARRPDLHARGRAEPGRVGARGLPKPWHGPRASDHHAAEFLAGAATLCLTAPSRPPVASHPQWRKAARRSNRIALARGGLWPPTPAGRLARHACETATKRIAAGASEAKSEGKSPRLPAWHGAPVGQGLLLSRHAAVAEVAGRASGFGWSGAESASYSPRRTGSHVAGASGGRCPRPSAPRPGNSRGPEPDQT